MRRRSKHDTQPDTTVRPGKPPDILDQQSDMTLTSHSIDIRMLYVQFVLSFVDQDTSTLVKSAFLEHHRDIFLSIFKGIAQDTYQLIHKILDVCWTGIWSDPKIKRSLKITLFNESTILQVNSIWARALDIYLLTLPNFQLMKIYDRIGSDSSELDHVPANLVHHFLLAICTHPGVGICFKDRGWYSPDSDGDEKPFQEDVELGLQRNNKIYNKILANVLKTLKVNEDLRQQELALKIMASCPELVAG